MELLFATRMAPTLNKYDRNPENFFIALKRIFREKWRGTIGNSHLSSRVRPWCIVRLFDSSESIYQSKPHTSYRRSGFNTRKVKTLSLLYFYRAVEMYV